MDKYFFKTKGVSPDISCIEYCYVQNNGVRIGSVICQECKYLIKHDERNQFTDEIDWIICEKIEEAIKSVQRSE